MSTRAFIGYQHEESRVEAIYCHSDGYIEHTGRILYEHYRDPNKVKALLAGGDISFLEEHIYAPKGHSYDNGVDGHTVFYRRDRGESFEGTKSHDYFGIVDFAKSAYRANADYTYLFKDNDWYIVGNDRQCFPLFNAIREKESTPV